MWKDKLVHCQKSLAIAGLFWRYVLENEGYFRLAIRASKADFEGRVTD
jgi:hypothetical protein